MASAFTACAMFAPNERKFDELDLPDTFTLYDESAPAPERWWEGFASPELIRLIDEAMESGLTIEQAYARLRQAEAMAVQAGAARWPDLNLTGGLSWTRTHTEIEDSGGDTGASPSQTPSGRTAASGTPTGSTGSGAATGSTATGAPTGTDAAAADTPKSITTTRKNKQIGLASTYELDLWGRVRSQYEAARLDREARREDLYTAGQTLAAEVTLRWLDILSHKQRMALVHDQIEANETTLGLMELRFLKAQGTALDIYQQRQIVAEAKSLLPPLEARLQTLQHELAVLLGKPPRADLTLEATSFPVVGALPGRGLPAELLSRRPDVRATGLQLRAADWQVSAARADRLPAVRLTASASYGAEDWSDVFDNWVATLAANMVAPLFDAGRRRAEVERTRAVVDERLAAYRQTVLTAIREVEDAMINEQKQVEFVNALTVRLDTARASHSEARARFFRGLSDDYLPVLSALTTTQLLERSLVQAGHQRLAFRVQLHRALGGSWMKEELEETRNQSNDGKK